MLGPGEIFTLFFVTLGPLKVLGPFAHRTAGLDREIERQIAVRVRDRHGRHHRRQLRRSCAVMVLNLLAMVFAHRLMTGVTLVLLQYFMTARHWIRSGTHSVPIDESLDGLTQWEVTIAEALSAAGYAAAHFGKWHLGSMRVLQRTVQR